MDMFEPSFIYEIVCIRKAMRRDFEVRAAPLEITVAQFHVLCRLWRGDGIATSVLTQEAGSDGGTVTGILDRLESRGLIRRERSTEDRRAVQIWLTPASRALEQPLMDIINTINQQALRGLSAAEKKQLMQILKRVESNLDE
jgi:DNA-binding MarR family transcriptional regulator